MYNSHKEKGIILTVFFIDVILTYNKYTKGRYKMSSDLNVISHTDGNKRISQLNLFGTHDSLTAFVDMENLSRCQSLTLKEQFALGVRLIDIRLCRRKGEFYLVHSLADCYTDESKKERLSFQSVLRDCLDFLKENPKEFLVLSIKQDRGIQSKGFFPEFYERHIRGNEENWCLKDEIPTADECRGKLVLMRRCKVRRKWKEKNRAGLDFSYWKDQGGKRKEKPLPVILSGKQKATVQDRYGLPPERKWHNCARPFLDKAQPDENNICMHFISTAYRYKNESLVKTAEEMNHYFKQYELTECKGWFFFDFPDESVANKFLKKGQGPRV